MINQWYHTSRWGARIKTVQADKVSGYSIWVNGRRRALRGAWDNYHCTWNAAKEFLLANARANVKGCQMRLNEAGNHLHKVQAITNDSN